jgi:glycosyltransferase involved in cell wall biosynthesis
MLKKIIAIDQGELVGGAEMFFSDLLNKISGEYEIHLITGNNPDYLIRYSTANIKVYNIDFFSISLRNIRNFYKIFSVISLYKKILLDVKPDLVISNTVRTHIFVSHATFSKKIPLIWMAHDTTFPKPVLRLLIKYPKKIITCSHYVAKYFRAISNNKTIDIVHPFGVDPVIFENFFNAKKENVIGMVGKFINWKGQDMFIRMAATLKKLGFTYKYEVIGNIYKGKKESEEYFNYCLSLIKKLKLENDLVIKTNINETNSLLKEIASWKFLIHYSKNHEPLGRVILEGMTVGCVVLSNDDGGPKEIITNTKNGFLLESDFKNFLQSVKIILNKPEEQILEISNNAKQAIFNNYSWPQVTEKFKKCLDL